MLVLVLDTSSAAVTAGIVGIGDGVSLRAERVVHNARGHGELLAPLIAECLAQAGATPVELAAIVVGTGPGPFTGLRVGLVTAAVLAQTLEIPAYGVCSLDALADQARDETALLVATDARRKEVYWARYERGSRVVGPEVGRPTDVPTEGVTAAVGAGIELYHDVFGVALLPGRFPTLGGLARCAAERVRTAAPSEPLTPLYLRRPDAVAPGAPKAVTQ